MMAFQRIMSIFRKEFIQILRDKRTLILVILIPIMQMLLLGYAATTDIKNIPMAVWDQSQTPQSRALLDAFRAADYFQIEYSVVSEEEYLSLIEKGDVKVALTIPPDYANRLLENNAQVLLILDGSDGNIGATALSSARLITQNYGVQLATERLSALGTKSVSTPITMHTQVLYNPDFESAYFMIPGVIGMILAFITTILTATTIVRERERGTIEQLIVTPIRSWELVIGKLLPYIVLAFAETFEVIIIGHLLFKVPVRGSLSMIVFASGIFLMSSLGIGLFASTLANTQQEAMLTVMMVILPSIFLSGFFFPIEAMPVVLRIISTMIPLRYFLVIIRSLMLKGVGITPIQNEIIALVLFGIVIMGAAAVRFRKRLD